MRFKATNLILLWLIAMLGGTLHGASTNVVSTQHFIIRFEDPKMEVAGVFLERAHEQFTNFFKGDDELKMQVRIFPNRKLLLASIEHLGHYFLVSPDDEDYVAVYHRETGTSYMCLRDWNYRSRKLLLAATSCQFHDLLHPWSATPALAACDHGIGSYLSLHNWDGRKLELGVIPSEEPVNYPREALSHYRKVLREDLQQWVEGKTHRHEALDWALVTFLIEKDRGHFETWRTALHNGVDAPYAWERHFGPLTPEFKASFIEWLESRARAWDKVIRSTRL